MNTVSINTDELENMTATVELALTLKPRMVKEGANAWICFWGMNTQSSLFGKGESPFLALADFATKMVVPDAVAEKIEANETPIAPTKKAKK